MTAAADPSREARRIEPPSRSGPLAAVVVCASIALYAGFLLAPRALTAITLAAVALTLVTAWLREPAAMHASLLVASLLGWYALDGPTVWPMYFVGPLATYAAAVFLVRPLRRSIGWNRRGRFDRITVALAVATTVLSSLALVVWLRVARPDVSDLVATIPHWSAPALLGLGVVFSVVNAALEEAIWRGVLLESLDAALGPGWLAVGIQAVSFGVAHVHGFPRGAVGVAMATAYGLALGIVRRQSGGMLAPFLAHIAADFTIFELGMQLIAHAG